MVTLCIMSFMFWASLQLSESADCRQATPDTRDVDVCSAAGIDNISVVRLKHTSSEEYKPCLCDIKLYKPTNFSINYYGPDTNACGIQISIENNQFTCYTGSLIPTINKSTRLTYTYFVKYDWCMDFKTEPPDARFNITCNSDSPMTPVYPSTSNEVHESTTPSSVTNTTSYPSSPLPTTDAPAANTNVTTAFHRPTHSTGESQSSYHTASETTPLISNWTSSESQPRKALQDIHIVIIVVGSTCLLLAAITVLVIYCCVCRRAKGTHSYESNALTDTTNLHSTHDYRNLTNQNSSDLEVINQMFIPADAMAFSPTNPSETSTDVRYADVGELTVKRTPGTDTRLVNSVSKASDQGSNGNAEIHGNVISETDVDPEYSVVQKNRDTDSKAKKVSFSVSKQDVTVIPTESHGTDNIYAQVNKKS